MKYFKNSELVQLYGVSDKAVRNWIESTLSGKLNLELHSHEGRKYVADNFHNGLILRELTNKGRKYRNSRSFRRLKPQAEFYALYTPEQIMHIVNELEIRREFPRLYRFVGRGAMYWDTYLQKLYSSSSANLLTASMFLLNRDIPYLDDHLENFKHVNLIIVGVGNGLSSRRIVYHLLASGKLRRCIGIDTSTDLLNITEKNYKSWFGPNLRFEKYTREIRHEQFDDILTANSYGNDASETTNIVLCLGGAMGNFRNQDNILGTIQGSMGKNDLLITSAVLDSGGSRDLSDLTDELHIAELASHNRMLPELLSFENCFYDIEQCYDKTTRWLLVQMRLKIATSLEIELSTFRKVVNFEKGEAIVLWKGIRLNDQEAEDILRRNGFAIVRMAKTLDERFILLMSRVKTIRYWPKP